MDYSTGKEIPRDAGKAVYWLTMAAERTNVRAVDWTSYGPDPAGFRCCGTFELCAEIDSSATGSALELAEMHLKGNLVPKDVDKARKFYVLAGKRRGAAEGLATVDALLERKQRGPPQQGARLEAVPSRR